MFNTIVAGLRAVATSKPARDAALTFAVSSVVCGIRHLTRRGG